MKKKILSILTATVLSVTMAFPSFAEIIWTPDKLPIGYTTNEWENKDFDVHSGTAIKRDTWTYYKKDLHGNIMKNIVFAGGSRVDENGIFTSPDGVPASYGSEQKYVEWFVSLPSDQIEHSAWHQDAIKPLNQNGVSNYWYGTLIDGSENQSHWQWLFEKPVGEEDGLMRAYCFNEYGYLYTNTVTPDGFIVNEFGQLMIDGQVITKTGHELLKNHTYSDAPIGYLVYDKVTDEKYADISFTDPYF